MATRRDPVSFSICQIGRLDCAPEIFNAINLANQTQGAFSFEIEDRAFGLSDQFRMANGCYDINAAISELLRTNSLPRPILFLTSEPYTDPSMQIFADLKEGGFFSDFSVAEGASIVSTHLWSQLPGVRRLQPYILYSLASVAFDYCASISMHDETRGCPFDYCDNPEDIDKSLRAPGLCPECLRQMDRATRSGKATLEQTGAAELLLNRAAGRKQAFVAMPFQAGLEPVFTAIRDLLSENNWKVFRADEMSYPRSITDAILHAIFASDLVIADVTGNNPNVFYELGWAHAVDRDVILLTQEQRIPFDVNIQRAIMYSSTNEQELAKVTRQLAQAVGISFDKR